jgi:serine/threonine protein kinase
LQSYSVDVFSLGCVYYFVLTKGEHPFGEPFRRQSNIVTGECDLDKLGNNSTGVIDLISLMISQDANSRPPLADVLFHPLFWSKEKVLSFFLDVSDRIEKEDESKCALLRKLESNGTAVVRDDWRDHICPEVAMDLRRYRTYKGQSVRDLLRALRNKKNHYRELTAEAQASLGHIPEQFVDYWTSRFPALLPYTWLKFESVRHEPIFSRYYPRTFSFNAGINGEFDAFNDYDEDFDSGRLDVPEAGKKDSEKSPKLDKNFWRSKSQFKTQKWRQQQQKNNLRENPNNFVSFGTRYTTSQIVQGSPNLNHQSPDTDNSWRNPVT